ncbi:type II toxin-antitoxin system PemK/MazF family toxin [Nocardioides dubius]|uniref:Type II toxin-antitoxin system PemK/MazF family toxin n=1 Tax=Nocardioides dubius TaxID=317019 RepID=A0ABN1U134_9ACTN
MSDAPQVSYTPESDGEPDPGEVVWAWVPYEEDPSQGKDRPVLLLARDGEHWLALQLTSVDHDRDEEQEARAGRLWMDVGSGDWDRERRPSEVRINRLLRIDDATVRREGAALPEHVFNAVVAQARLHLPI